MIEHSENVSPEARKIGVGDKINGLHIPLTYIILRSTILAFRKHFKEKQAIVVGDLLFYPIVFLSSLIVIPFCAVVLPELDLLWTLGDFSRIINRALTLLCDIIVEFSRSPLANAEKIMQIKLYERK